MKKYNDILADERPEFKAANYGFDSLSNTELLSMVINRGAGTAESLSQARLLMNMADNNLSNLAKLSMDEMQVVQGIGDCKALAVLAALELGKRRAVEKLGSKPDMGSSLAIYNYMLPQMADLKVEQASMSLSPLRKSMRKSWRCFVQRAWRHLSNSSSKASKVCVRQYQTTRVTGTSRVIIQLQEVQNFAINHS